MLWNKWKNALFEELYHKTLLALRRGLENPINKDMLIRETKDRALTLIDTDKKLKSNVDSFWDSLGEDYFIRHSSDEIAWHTQTILNGENLRLPLIMVREETFRGGTEVFIYMKNQDNIFSTTTRVLDQLGLTIVDARIITSSNDYALDTYMVLENSGEIIKDKHRKDEIINALEQALSLINTFPKKISRVKPRQLKHFPIPTEVNFSLDERNIRTIMEVIATDRPGLLSHVGMALEFCGARLQSAKIATYGARVEDIFFITDRNNQMITDPIKLECLSKSIVESLAVN
ncbi:MAG: hypothetical protein HY356_04935 [Gammaproteobacteria bacterium]|nr:hypothetical protein [Gammaproteobacteria bacterium]